MSESCCARPSIYGGNTYSWYDVIFIFKVIENISGAANPQPVVPWRGRSCRRAAEVHKIGPCIFVGYKYCKCLPALLTYVICCKYFNVGPTDVIFCWVSDNTVITTAEILQRNKCRLQRNGYRCNISSIICNSKVLRCAAFCFRIHIAQCTDHGGGVAAKRTCLVACGSGARVVNCSYYIIVSCIRIEPVVCICSCISSRNADQLVWTTWIRSPVNFKVCFICVLRPVEPGRREG